MFFVPEDYGAVGNGIANDSPALDRMYDAARNSIGIGVGPVEMVLSSGKKYGQLWPWHLYPTRDFNFRLIGAGDGLGGSRLAPLPGFTPSPFFPAASIVLPGEVDEQLAIASYTIGGFGIENKAGAACKSGIRWGVDGRRLNGLKPNLIHDITVFDFERGVDVWNTGLLEFNRVGAWCKSVQNSFGWFFSVSDGANNSEHLLKDCTSDSSVENNGSCIGFFNESSSGGISGIHIDVFKGYHAKRFIHGRMTGTGLVSTITMANSQLDGAGETGVFLEAFGGGHHEDWGFRDTYIRGCLDPFLVKATGGSEFIGLKARGMRLLNNVGKCQFEGTRTADFSGNTLYGGSAPGQPAISWISSRGFNCHDNHASLDYRPSISSFSEMVRIAADCNSFSVQGNNAGDMPMTGGAPDNVRDLTPSTAKKKIANNQ